MSFFIVLCYISDMQYTVASSSCPIQLYADHSSDHPAIEDINGTITYEQLHQWAHDCVQQIQPIYIPTEHSGLCIQSSYPGKWIYVALIAALRLGIPLAIFNSSDPSVALDDTYLSVGPDDSADIPLPPIPKHFSRILPVTLSPKSTLTHLATSGTTSRPKWVAHSANAHFASATALRDYFQLGPTHKWLVQLPLHHVSGLAPVFRMMLCGGTVCFSSNTHDIVQDCDLFSITHLSCVSTTLLRLLDHPLHAKRTEHLQGILLGGGPIPARCRQHPAVDTLPIHVSYGMTEAASTIAVAPFKDFLSTHSLIPLPHSDIRIDDNQQILLQTASLFTGYLNQKILHRPVEPNGYFPTSDHGQLHENKLTLWGRSDRMFVSGGENIFPSYIESVIRQFPNVDRVHVAPQEDPEFQYVAHAYVSGHIDLTELTTFLADHLARYNRPKHITLCAAHDAIFDDISPK